MTLDIGILLALACAFVANLGFFYKYRGANSVPKVQVRHPLRSARQLYSSKWFALGMLIAIASWGLHVAALSLAPMSVVQVVAGRGHGVHRRDGRAACSASRSAAGSGSGCSLTAAGLVLLGVTLPAMHGAHSHFSQVADDRLRGRPVRARRPAADGPADGRRASSTTA